ncbi:tail fiber domain-containing protein [Spirosoma sp. BT702]|uniref:Tail fiber domain-containing protein n=1 Tax=Spirosoma profusum TaxID=2771354 RepID=A0A926XUM7_9BACT|nr:tail fiber domain-containing protein [Spirosoma profusum]MBD2700804.1 tail fiber domain-containing protein [Spirosoma profusum]
MQKKLLHLLTVGLLVVQPLFVRAQMGFNSPVGLTPKQDIEMYSRNKFQVQTNYRLTTDPVSGTYTMNCTIQTIETTTGVLLDPGGAGNYPASFTCSTSIYDDANVTAGYELTFELLNTEANGDSVIIEDAYGGRAAYSGNVHPTSALLVPGYGVTVTFKSDNDTNVGAGFRLRWRRLYQVDPGNYDPLGSGLVYDITKASLVSGFHGFSTIPQAGYASFITGSQNSAKGVGATALGLFQFASGNYSFAVGYSNVALLQGSIAMGENNRASGSNSVAIGENNIASGGAAVTIGESNTASSTGALALGYKSIASGGFSVALGNAASTNGFTGAFAVGDASTSTRVTSTTVNQYTSRFAGGYRLFTNSATTVGVQLAANGNAWLSISDSTKKERFLPIDHADLLTSIRTLRLGTWNYKGQRSERHYGPMAQDFFARFGRDALGTIGCDTLLNSHDFTAVTLSGVQALALENEQLKAQILELKQQAERERKQTATRLEALERALLIRPSQRVTQDSRRKKNRL